MRARSQEAAARERRYANPRGHEPPECANRVAS